MSKVFTLNTELLAFSRNYDTTHEDKATSARGQFIRAYPLRRLKDSTLDEYVIGKRTPSFCTYVEARTKAWANIQGATSFKFGIYFGKTQSDLSTRYRFTGKFGKTKKQAFNGGRALTPSATFFHGRMLHGEKIQTHHLG